MGHRRVALLLVGLVALPAATVALSGTAARATQRTAECPDPTILVDHTRRLAVTLMCTGRGFPTRSAATIQGLRKARPHFAFAADGWPTWAHGKFWAPDLEHIGSQYLLYYSARLRGTWRHGIGVAVSDRPAAGFRDVGAPLIDIQPYGAIDPALLTVGDQLFLIYKRDGNPVRAPSVILGAPLSADGLQLAGPSVELLRSRRGGWEQGVIENPAPIHLGDTTYLLYSEGLFYAPGYAEGEAVGTGDPLGTYTKVSAAPVLRGGKRWVGTGGGSIVVDGDRLLLAYAAFRSGELPLRRKLFIRDLVLAGGVLRPVGPARQIPLRP